MNEHPRTLKRDIPPNGVVESRSFDTGMLPPWERFSFWKEAIFDSLTNCEIQRVGDESFRGKVRWRGFALEGGSAASFSDVGSVAIRARRDRRHIARDHGGTLTLFVQTQGSARWRQGGRESGVGLGDMFILDGARVGGIDFPETYRQFTFQFPYERIAPRLPRGDVWLGRALKGDSPLGRVLLRDLAAVSAALERVDPAALPGLVDRTVDLVALAFAGELRAFRGCAGTVKRALALRAMHFVDAHLARPDLSVSDVAAALGVSAGYLHRAFQGEGTSVARYIGERRLLRCRQDLADPLWAQEQIGQIALRWGYRDMAHFSRVFRGSFGRSPREYRAEAAGVRKV